MLTTVAVPPVAAVRPPGAARAFVSQSLVFARRNVEHIRQIPEKLMDVTIQPLMFVLLFVYVFGGAIHVEGGGYREYLIGGILIQGLAFGLMGPAMSIATDLHEGVIDRFRSLPATRSAYLMGHYVAEIGGSILSIAILLGAGAAVGWRAHTAAGSITEAVLLLLAFATAMIWLGTLVGMVVRSADAAQGLVFVIVFPLTFLSSAFVPIDSMPNALQWVASWNPISALVAAVRELFGNPGAPIAKDVWPMQHPVAAAWLYCAALLVAVIPSTLRRFRRRTSD